MHDTKPARAPSAKPLLDRIDRAILRALRGAGRLTYQALAERVG
jgi:DNA-binding Lrp family transcriptional regulator